MSHAAPLILSELTAVSPIDGRYARTTSQLGHVFSEYAFFKFRTLVELNWLLALSSCPEIDMVPALSKDATETLYAIYRDFSPEDAQAIKNYERTINHDVKAVEYFIKDKFKAHAELHKISEFVHFACTSEDINNLSHALMLKFGLENHLLGAMDSLISKLKAMAREYATAAMISRTHGQVATPSTMGKEIAVYVFRLQRQRSGLAGIPLLAKCAGAVSNFNAHHVAFPGVDWMALSNKFIMSFNSLDATFHGHLKTHLNGQACSAGSSLVLKMNPLATQIESHDYMAEIFHAIARFNTILLDLDRDFWMYISAGHFKQIPKQGEVGSSTMPHKVNPIDFENSEGNIGLANALLLHMGEKLPVSRWQRDLSDSTVLRNLGVAFSYSTLAYTSTLCGLSKLALDTDCLATELNRSWEVLAEPVQTVMRKYALESPYERLKELTRGNKITKESLHAFISGVDGLPEPEKQALLKLTPHSYTGYAARLASELDSLLDL